VNSHLQVRVKRQSRWQQIPIETRHAAIEISTRNPRCTGDYLAAQLEWARDRFGAFRFIVGDTLQVHNYVILGHPQKGSVDEDAAYELCLSEGDEWIDNNHRRIGDLLKGHSFRIHRWNELMADPIVDANLRKLRSAYRSDLAIFDLVRQDVRGYLDRRHANTPLTDEQLRRLDLHVLEELAVFQYQAEYLNLVSIYPGASQLLLRPKYRDGLQLPQPLIDRHYITLDIKIVAAGEPVGTAVS
jgi:tRNA-dependent cyclodipeptide synthase